MAAHGTVTLIWRSRLAASPPEFGPPAARVATENSQRPRVCCFELPGPQEPVGPFPRAKGKISREQGYPLLQSLNKNSPREGGSNHEKSPKAALSLKGFGLPGVSHALSHSGRGGVCSCGATGAGAVELGAPAGPGGPATPAGPASPLSPLSPASPLAPFSPGSPFSPFGP